MSFIERLKMLLKNKGMTASELTAILKVGKTRINDWERGKSTPSPEILIGLSQIFGVSIDWLLTGKGSSEMQIEVEYILSKEDKELIEAFNQLNRWGQSTVLHTIRQELEKLEQEKKSEKKYSEEESGQEISATIVQDMDNIPLTRQRVTV